MLECVDACIGVFGAGRVGMHLAPRGDAHTMGDSDRLGTFGYVAEQLGRRGLAFLCTREAVGADSIAPELERRFGGVLIANPDLPHRRRERAPLNAQRPESFYWDGKSDIRVGYTDYPALPPRAN